MASVVQQISAREICGHDVWAAGLLTDSSRTFEQIIQVIARTTIHEDGEDQGSGSDAMLGHSPDVPPAASFASPHASRSPSVMYASSSGAGSAAGGSGAGSAAGGREWCHFPWSVV